jgi:ABC-2 type transport system permease protein
MGGAVATIDAGTPPPTRRLWHDLAESLRNPGFWALSSWLDILVRSRKSYLGPFWLLAPGVAYVFGIGSFFASMFNRSIPEFAVHVSLGIVVFRTLMSALVGSAGVFSSSQSFILDGHMRLTDFVMQSLARSAFDMLMTLPVVAAALLLHGQADFAGLLLALPVMLLIYLNAFWISVAFALVGARFVDLGQALATVSTFMFLLTPIIWYPESVPQGSIRATLMLFNPLYHFVEVFRSPIVGTVVQPVSVWVVGVSTAGGLLLATLLYRRYARFVPLWI